MDAPRVLLIDGDRDSLVIYSLVLEHYGLQVLKAMDGDQGFRLACEHQPDLIVLEPFVPVIGDRPITELLRSDARTAGLRVLLVTAVPHLLDDLEQSAGFGTFLIKPCQPRLFLAEVQRRLGPTLMGAA